MSQQSITACTYRRMYVTDIAHCDLAICDEIFIPAPYSIAVWVGIIDGEINMYRSEKPRVNEVTEVTDKMLTCVKIIQSHFNDHAKANPPKYVEIPLEMANQIQLAMKHKESYDEHCDKFQKEIKKYF